MARYAIQGTVRDTNGKTIKDASVQIFLAGTSTPATIYTAKVGGSAYASSIMTTDIRGHFVGYIDDSDYDLFTQFDLSVTGTGLAGVTYNDIMAVTAAGTIDVSGASVSVIGQDYAAASPTTGTWPRGWIRWNSNPTSGENIGWVCVTAGTPGTWYPFGSISLE